MIWTRGQTRQHIGRCHESGRILPLDPRHLQPGYQIYNAMVSLQMCAFTLQELTKPGNARDICQPERLPLAVAPPPRRCDFVGSFQV